MSATAGFLEFGRERGEEWAHHQRHDRRLEPYIRRWRLHLPERALGPVEEGGPQQSRDPEHKVRGRRAPQQGGHGFFAEQRQGFPASGNLAQISARARESECNCISFARVRVMQMCFV